MPTESIELSRFLPATPDRIYLAWLNGPEHAAMTGATATVASAEVGGAFTAWDGYIDGVHVALEPGKRIVQAWRTDDFPADAPESHLEVLLEPVPGGTQLTLRHDEIPEGQGPGYLAGWDEFYLEPMARFFAAEAKRRGMKGPAEKRTTRAAAKRPAAKRTPARRGTRAGTGAGRVAARKAARKARRKVARKAARKPRR
jgi:uncharacterized protein YndB with AHSA1/START domain